MLLPCALVAKVFNRVITEELRLVYKTLLVICIIIFIDRSLLIIRNLWSSWNLCPAGMRLD
jgi:hypothetical protein